MKGIVLLACLMLLLAAPAVFAEYDSWGNDDWTYDTGTSGGCCCGPSFILVAGLAAFAYSYQRK